MADSFAFRFSTKYLDSETALWYYGYRYYDADGGRWLSRDPIGERGSRSLHGFALNDPITVGDALGWSPIVLLYDAQDKTGMFKKMGRGNFGVGGDWGRAFSDRRLGPDS